MHCWARYLFLAVVAALSTGQMLAACGQKGDLYLVKEGNTTAREQPRGQGRTEAPVPPDYAAPADGASLDVLDAVPSETPDPGGI
jgi:predicted small lipoprotein YifL